MLSVPSRNYSTVWAFVVVTLFIISPDLVARAQDNLQAWENFDFATQSIKQQQLAEVSLDDLKFLRGIVFGRHGRVFKDPAIKDYLEKQSWYTPSADFKNSMLNDVENKNLDLIRDAEASKHDVVQPGDMRFWRTRPLSRKQLGQHSSAEWLVLRSEVEAIHGKRFNDQPWLQQYFEERYWYRAADKYDPKQLSAIEQRNLATIAAAQKLKRRVALSPGDMEFFENKPIAAQLLKGLGLYELRLIRNEIYARHGRQFQAI